MNLKEYGWDEYFEKEWSKNSNGGMFPGRIIADYGQMLRVFSEFGELLVNRPVCKNGNTIQLAVGDWVALENSQKTNLFR